MEKSLILKDIIKIKEFVNDMSKYFPELDVDVRTQGNHYIVDGKSIMGILSLNLSEPIIVKIDTPDSKLFDKALSKYVGNKQ